MPRNANGTYTLPSGNPVVGGTYITTTWANPTMEDLAAALTDSLSRSGAGGMQVPFKNLDGNITTPGITWTNEQNTGFYRAASQDMRASVGGVDRMRWTAAGVQTWNGTVWSSLLTQAALDAALLNYANLNEAENILGAWVFNAGLTTSLIDSTAGITFEVGGTSKGVLGAAAMNYSVPVQVNSVALALSSVTVTGGTSLTGGGDLSANRVITLVNDVASPGTSFYYGTNSSGVKGFYALSSTGGVPEAPIDGTTYGRKDASWVAVGSGGSFLPLTGGTLTGPLVIDYAAAQTVLTVKGANPWLIFNNDSSAANAKKWGIDIAATSLTIRTHTDPGSTGSDAIVITRGAGATTIASLVYGNITDNPTHTFRGAVTAANGLAVTGAATISTTLGVTGATTLAATTISGLTQISNQLQLRSGNGAFFYDSTNANNVTLGLDNTTKQLLVGAKGALWYWDSSQTLNRGGITIATVAPVGNDAAKAGNIVLVYE
jgi:hypothetical protein